MSVSSGVRVRRSLRLDLRHDADLFVGQVARRIGFPVVAECAFGARAEVAVAAAQPLAGCAAAAEFLFAVAEAFEERDVTVGPDLRELALADIADDVMLRELVGVDL